MRLRTLLFVLCCVGLLSSGVWTIDVALGSDREVSGGSDAVVGDDRNVRPPLAGGGRPRPMAVPATSGGDLTTAMTAGGGGRAASEEATATGATAAAPGHPTGTDTKVNKQPGSGAMVVTLSAAGAAVVVALVLSGRE